MKKILPFVLFMVLILAASSYASLCKYQDGFYYDCSYGYYRDSYLVINYEKQTFNKGYEYGYYRGYDKGYKNGYDYGYYSADRGYDKYYKYESNYYNPKPGFLYEYAPAKDYSTYYLYKYTNR